MKNKHLKRLAALILCAVLCLTAVACGKQDSGNDESSLSSSGASAQETVEAGNTAEPTKNEADVAQEEESAAPQQTAAPAKATEKSTEKKTEKQTAAPKTETQTPVKKKLTQAEVDKLNRQHPFSSNFANSSVELGVEFKFSLRGNSLVLSIIAISSEKMDDNKLADFFNATESIMKSSSKGFLEEYDIDSFIYEAVNKDGKIICSKEYK
mgnify:CR=1 FL=1